MRTLLQVDSTNDRTVEIIKAIGSTWPLAIVIILTLIFIIYQKKISFFISKFNKVSGKTPLVEVNFEKESEIKPLTSPTSEEKVMKETSKELSTKTEVSSNIDVSFHSISLKLSEGKISEANDDFVLMQEKESDSIAKEENILTFLYYKYLHAGENTLAELENRIHESKYNDVKILGNRYLGNCYFKSQDFPLAIKLFNEAYLLSQDESDQTEMASDISMCYFEMSKKDEAIKYLKTTISSIKSKINKAKLYFKLSSYYDKSIEWLEKCLALELAVTNDPNNQTYLFYAGHAFSSDTAESRQGLQQIALIHYKDLIRYHEDSSGGFNNLGVVFNDLKLDIKAAEMYAKANELNATLAASNLANKYISQGFIKEALVLLDKAKVQKDVHESVWESLKKIADELKREDDEEKKILVEGKISQFYLREFSSVFFNDELNFEVDFKGVWKYNNEIIEITPATNSEYVVLSWIESGDNFKINLKLKNTIAFIEGGELKKKESYSTSKLIVFGLFKADSIKIFLFEKAKGTNNYNFVIQRERLL